MKTFPVWRWQTTQCNNKTYTHWYAHIPMHAWVCNDLIKYAVETYKIFFDDSIKWGNPVICELSHHIMVGFTTIIAHCYHLLKSAYKYLSHLLELNNNFFNEHNIRFPTSQLWLSSPFWWQSDRYAKIQNYLTCVIIMAKELVIIKKRICTHVSTVNFFPHGV